MSNRFDPLADQRKLMETHRRGMLEAIREIVKAKVAGDALRITTAEGALASRIAGVQTVADLVARARVVEQASRLRNQPAGGMQIPEVSFDRAVKSVVSRVPQLAKPVDGEPLYKAVQRVYAENGFALARAADARITDRVARAKDALQRTERVQIGLTRAVKQGTPNRLMADVLRETEDWTQAYAENVVQTNLTGAYADGILEQVRDPDVARIIGALRFNAVRDSATRDNHLAAHGFIAPPDAPEWQRIKPPLGYSCRCAIAFVTIPELRRLGLVDAEGNVRTHYPPNWDKAGKDAGFV